MSLEHAVNLITEHLRDTQFRETYGGELALTEHMSQQGWNPETGRRFYFANLTNKFWAEVDFKLEQVSVEIKYAHDEEDLTPKLMEGFWQMLAYSMGYEGVLLVGVCDRCKEKPRRFSDEARKAMGCVPARAFVWSIADGELEEI